MPKLLFAGIMIAGTLFCQNQEGKAVAEDRTGNFPKQDVKVEEMPARQNLWVFLLAGQSNMAGRGFVEAGDTLPDKRILTITKNKQWILAKEPLHFYEPALTGLDCGLSFGRELIKHIPDSVSIALIPCAVGGSSIQQWLGDSLFRGVHLLSNLNGNVDFVKRIWHC